ncbi:unnamed protein product [Bursaphelenchus xylophilus]|uniref:(pine wood nematode) hypothetical protein n=1 Tax=Bursaphelenchus xylophilus TaxID=6326 RepID=A0A1I7RYZ4_BURXY|nr:unnamed protein product [Bursaphelenchus xylophilus]CAG9107009.1 unnamed protein product [Bursaphelenchus xylophilus]
MSDLETGIRWVLDRARGLDENVQKLLLGDDIKVQLHQLLTDKLQLPTVILCIARYLYEKDEKKSALIVLDLFDRDNYAQSRLYRKLRERLLLELEEYQEYLNYGTDSWNCSLICAFNGSDLALKYLWDWKKISPNDPKLGLLFLFLNRFNDAKFELEMKNQVTEEGLGDICLCYMHMQWPHLALPYLTKLHLLSNDIETKFTSFLERCRCLIFMNKTSEALKLLTEGKNALTICDQDRLWINLTFTLCHLTSHQLANFYNEISRFIKSLDSIDNIPLDMEIHLLEMLSFYFLTTNQLKKTLQTSQSLLKLLLSNNDDNIYSHHLATVYGIIGKVFIASDDFVLAEMTLLKGLEKAGEIGVPTLMVDLLSILVGMYRSMKNNDLRHHYLKEELGILSQSDGSESIYFEWKVRLDYGIYLKDEAQLEDAELELEKALAIVQELHLSIEEALIHEILAEVSAESGDEQKKYCRLEQAKEIWVQLPYPKKTERVSIKVLETMEELKIVPEAIKLAKELLERSESKTRVTVTIILARILIKEKKFEEIYYLLDQAKKEAKSQGMAKELGHIYGLFGEFYFAINNRKMAVKNFCRQVQFFDFMNDPQGQTDTLKYIIMHKMIKNDISGAIKVIKMRVTAAEKGSITLNLTVLDQSITTLLQLNADDDVIDCLNKKSDLILNNSLPDSSDQIIVLIARLKSLNLMYKAQTILSTYLNQNLEQCDERHFLELSTLLSDYDQQLSVDLLESIIYSEHFHIQLVNRLIYLYLDMGTSEKAVELFRDLTKKEIHLDFFDVLTMSLVEGSIGREKCVEMALQLSEDNQTEFFDNFNLYNEIPQDKVKLLSPKSQIHWLFCHNRYEDSQIEVLTDNLIKEKVMRLALLEEDPSQLLCTTTYNNWDFDFVTIILMIFFGEDIFDSIYSCEFRKWLKIQVEWTKIGKKFECANLDKEKLKNSLRKYDNFAYIHRFGDYKIVWIKEKDTKNIFITSTSSRNTFWNTMINRLVDKQKLLRISTDHFQRILNESAHLFGDCLDQKTSASTNYFIINPPNKPPITHDSSVIMIGKSFEEYQKIPGFILLSTQEDVFQTLDQVKSINKSAVLLVDPIELNPIFLLETEARPKVLVLVGSTWSHLPLWPVILTSTDFLMIYKTFEDFQKEMIPCLIEQVNHHDEKQLDLVGKIQEVSKNGILHANSDGEIDVRCKSVKLRNSLRKALTENNTSNWLTKHPEIMAIPDEQVLRFLDYPMANICEVIINSTEPHRTNLQHLYYDYCITHQMLEKEIFPVHQKVRYRSRRKKMRPRSGMSSRCSSRSSMNSDVCLLSEAETSDSESTSRVRVIAIGME